jgi:hypothetical protein
MPKGDMSWEIAERARELLRPILEIAREAIYSGPDTVEMSKAEFRKHVLAMSPAERLQTAQALGMDNFLSKVI